MKIGYDAKRAFFNFRGLGNYSRTLLLSLDKFYPLEKYFLYTPTYSSPKAQEFEDKISSDSSTIHTPKNLLSKKFPSWWRSFFLAKRISQDSLDIFHGLSHELPRGIDKLKIKKVVTIHDLIFLRYPEFFPFIDRVIYKRKFLHSTQVADKVIAICQQTKQDLIEFLGVDAHKIQVIYQSCDPLFYDLKDDNELQNIAKKYGLINHGFILNVGAIEERKNTLSLVKAFDQIKNQTSLNLILIGNGKLYCDRIKSYINSHDLSDRVRILFDVAHEELPAIYQLAKMTVYPSFFEGFGIPIIESLFSQTPVITSKGSCFPEAGGPGALYVDPNSTDEIANEILRLDTDEDLYLKLKTDGREFVQKFHWENTSKVMHDFYINL